MRVTGVSLALAGTGAWAVQRAMRPNLLIIHTDEHNFRTLGCYRNTLPNERAFIWGEQITDTPNIDWISNNGAICTKFYASTPVCTPSRASFLTGRYPHNTGSHANDHPLNDGNITFAEILRRQGYRTGYAGKWHLDGDGKPQWAPERQFGFEDNRYMFNRGHWKKLELSNGAPQVAAHKKNGKPSYNLDGADEKSYATDWLTDRAIDFVRGRRDAPFCYMLSIPDPHDPNRVRAPYDTMYDPAKVKTPATFHKTAEQTPAWATRDSAKLKEEDLPKIMTKYFGMVKCIDDNVGRLLKVLREEKLMDNTIVIFTSDHGDLCGEHGRKNKGNPLEASAKVAFVIYYPEKIKAGTRVDQTLSTVDFLPTILGVMGIKTLGAEEGRDASGFFAGASPSGWEDGIILRGTTSWLAAVNSRYKLVYSKVGDPWLFDMEKHPDELTNSFSDPEYRDIVRKMTQDIMAYAEKHNDPHISKGCIKTDMAKVLEGSKL